MTPNWRQSGRHWLERLVSPNDHNIRLDRWLDQEFKEVPNSFIQKQLRKGNIRLIASQTTHQSGRRARASEKLQPGNVLAIRQNVFDELSQQRKRFLPSKDTFNLSDKGYFEKLYERIQYKDGNFFILDKPSGLAVQGGDKSTRSLAYYFPLFQKRLRETDGPETHFSICPELPRLVHRIDKGTSGLVVIARHRRAAAAFSELLRDRKIEKVYQAFVIPTHSTEVPKNGRVESILDGKEAITLYKAVEPVSTEENFENLNLRFPHGKSLKLWPITGRKHQLRIHCATVLHAPILGDIRYGGRTSTTLKKEMLPQRMYLHATKISFPNPFFFSAHDPRTIDIECPVHIP